MTEAEIRSQFPGTENVVYFNTAAGSLLPRPVLDRMHEVALRQCETGILSHGGNARRVETARQAAARLIGCEASHIAFTSGTADGISRIAGGLEWREGDEVVLADLEFPANVYPWAAQRPRGVRLRFVRSQAGRIEPERYIEAIGPRTRVLTVSHVQFSSGYRIDLQPLAEACRKRAILLVVDAIQSLGVVPLDVKKTAIGALAVDGRKWLMGPSACGFLYVAPEWNDRVRPNVVGTHSVNEPDDFMQYVGRIDADGQLDIEPMLRPGTGRHEAGYPNMVSLAGLGAALELGESIGHEVIERRVRMLVDRFVERVGAAGLEVHGPRSADERAGIVAFESPGDPDKIFRRLNGAGYSLAVRDGRLRVSPHVYNTAEEVDAIVDRVLALGS